jgi:hypothetical protein
MVLSSDQLPDPQAPAIPPRSETESTLADLVIDDQTSSVIRSTLAFSTLCHAGQRRDSDGAAFIQHPLEVAGLLHHAGCSDVVVAAGLLHDLIEDTQVTVEQLTAQFGPDIAQLVQAVSEDPSIPTYRRRKRSLREQVRHAGRDAALVFAADKIAKVAELPDRARRNQARIDAARSPHRTRERLDHSFQLRLEHYHESLRMLEQVAPGHPLVRRLANELDSHPIGVGPAMTGDRAEP